MQCSPIDQYCSHSNQSGGRIGDQGDKSPCYISGVLTIECLERGDHVFLPAVAEQCLHQIEHSAQHRIGPGD